MSGIDKMKDKIKKKMTLNDLPSPEGFVFLETPTVHTTAHTEVQPYVCLLYTSDAADE